MTTSYRFTPEAVADLFEIWSYIASDNVEAADRVEAAIYEACSFLAQSPLSGQVRKSFTNRPVRFWTVQRFPNYVLVYRPDTQPLEVIRILHAKQNVQRILGQNFSI
ncbi:MAG: type II toxin-antitoxin system RelE/ParE family toxin [Bryobacteraceae bacterium]